MDDAPGEIRGYHQNHHKTKSRTSKKDQKQHEEGERGESVLRTLEWAWIKKKTLVGRYERARCERGRKRSRGARQRGGNDRRVILLRERGNSTRQKVAEQKQSGNPADPEVKRRRLLGGRGKKKEKTLHTLERRAMGRRHAVAELKGFVSEEKKRSGD